MKRRSREVGKTRVDAEYDRRAKASRLGNDEDESERNGVWRRRYTPEQIQEMQA